VVNGFEGKDYLQNEQQDLFPDFTITYAGWLYDSQQIEILCEAVKAMVDGNAEIKLQLLSLEANHFQAWKQDCSINEGLRKIFEADRTRK